MIRHEAEVESEAAVLEVDAVRLLVDALCRLHRVACDQREVVLQSVDLVFAQLLSALSALR